MAIWFRVPEPRKAQSMTISSMEQLEALPVGGAVRVASTVGSGSPRVFTRVKDGFDYDGAVVDPKWFVGYVAEGKVQNFATGDPEAGDFFVSGGRHGYIILLVADGMVTIAQFSNDRFVEVLSRRIEDVRGFNWTRKAPSDRPAWYDTMYPVLIQMSQVRVNLTNTQTDYARAEGARVEAVRELAALKEARVAQVAVVATGTSEVPVEKAAGLVPEGATVSDVTATWRRMFTVTTEPVRGCACGISREQVAELLTIEDDGTHEWTFHADCGRH